MYNSILQYLEELARRIEEKATFENLKNIDSLAADLEKDCKDVARRMLQDIITELNQTVRSDKETRKASGLYMQEKDRVRRLYTALGELEFQRDYYKCDEGYVYPLDSFLGIEPRKRIGSEVCARLVSHAAYMSYAKSTGEVTGRDISRQSVHTLIRKMPALEIPAPEEKRQVKELHIYADEDHVHMQKPDKEKGKCSKIVPLVTVTEGTTSVSLRRRKTINPIHFVDVDFNAKRLWESVDGYIQSAYETGSIESICIHGDGGGWIKNGLEDYKQTIHVIDQWHFEKALKAISAKYPGRNLRIRIHNAAKQDDMIKACKILDDIIKAEEDEKKIKAVTDFRTYLMNNWSGIVNRLNGSYPGSCTEGQVSHVLSERFSRDPLGWSEENLGKLTKIRAYILNGGEIHSEDIKGISKASKMSYADRMEALFKEKLSSPDFSMFGPEPLIIDGSSGTQYEIRSLGACRMLS